MNGTLYVQKKNADGTLTAGWIHKCPCLGHPMGPGQDALTLDLEKALIFDLNNHCDQITAYLDAGYTVRTGDNLLHRPDAKSKPNSLTIAQERL